MNIKLKAKYRVGGRSTYKSGSSISGTNKKKGGQTGNRVAVPKPPRKRVRVLHANGKVRMHDAA